MLYTSMQSEIQITNDQNEGMRQVSEPGSTKMKRTHKTSLRNAQ